MKAFWLGLVALCIGLTGCAEPSGETQAAEPRQAPEGTNVVAVIGAIHGQHRRSETYSLDALRAAILKFEPDVLMIELPPERFATAAENFEKFGEVRESRADDFPELVDVVFPLWNESRMTIIPVAAWTQDIADNRRAALAALEQDPDRAADWSAYQDAIRTFGNAVRGRSDDPQFIHSAAYDAAVKARQETYESLFGKDLGPGGWEAINAAHYSNIDGALNRLSRNEQRILILYGAWHKYWFLERLQTRNDIFLVDAAELFAN